MLKLFNENVIFQQASQLCSIMYEQPIELIFEMLLHCVTLNSNIHYWDNQCSVWKPIGLLEHPFQFPKTLYEI